MKSGSDRDTPLFYAPDRGLRSWTRRKRTVWGRERKRSGLSSRAHGTVTKSRSQEVACPPGDPPDEAASARVPSFFSVALRRPLPRRGGPQGYRPSPLTSPQPSWPPVTDSIDARAATCPFPRLNNAARPTWRSIAHHKPLP